MNTVNEKEIFNLQLDPSFVEEAVFLYARECISREKVLIDDFHRAREALYVKESLREERDKAFRSLAADYFRKMGLRERLENILRDFPLLSGPDILILVKRVWNKKQEEVELFVRGRQKTVCIGLQTLRILDMSFLEGFLRHELMHISDMLDPRFEYDPRVSLGGETELEDNLIRDRFHSLWDMDIQARLLTHSAPTKMSGLSVSTLRDTNVLKKGFLPAKNTHQDMLGLARGFTRAQKEKEKCPRTL